jgi:hypothetical protein
MDPAASLANRAFEREGWARERLAAHAGRVMVVVIGPVATGMRIDSSGRFQSTPLAGRTPDLTLTLSPLGVPSLLANPARWSEFVIVDGDSALAATLQELAHTLPGSSSRPSRTRSARSSVSVSPMPDDGCSPSRSMPPRGGRKCCELRPRRGRTSPAWRRNAHVRRTDNALAERADTLAARFDALDGSDSAGRERRRGAPSAKRMGIGAIANRHVRPTLNVSLA